MSANDRLTREKLQESYNVLAYVFGKDHVNDPAYLNNLNDLREAALASLGPDAQGGKCPECGGSGIYRDPSPSPTLEPCPACQGTGAKPPSNFKPMSEREIEGVVNWDHGSEYAQNHIRACQAEIERLTTQRPQRGGEGV